jgi:8-oxo-dGTP diphosphatase
MTEFPLSDGRGRTLVSLDLIDDVDGDVPVTMSPCDCSLVTVVWNAKVLFGFNVERQRWELPGGSVEVGESDRDAAIRELVEETGIQVDDAALAARAVLRFEDTATEIVAAVFVVVVQSAPVLVESDELQNFTWWDPADEPFEGQCLLDAVAVRHSLSHLDWDSAERSGRLD